MMFVGCLRVRMNDVSEAGMNGASFTAGIFWSFLSSFTGFYQKLCFGLFDSLARSLNHWPKDSKSIVLFENVSYNPTKFKPVNFRLKPRNVSWTMNSGVMNK